MTRTVSLHVKVGLAEDFVYGDDDAAARLQVDVWVSVLGCGTAVVGARLRSVWENWGEGKQAHIASSALP